MNNSYPFRRTRIKICGFTRTEDARYAAELGVDAVGMVFYPPSPRNVDISKAREIVGRLPAFVTVVALFVDEQAEIIHQVLENVRVDLLQFHGSECPADCNRFGIPYIKAVRMSDQVQLEVLEQDYSDARGLLLDTYHPDAVGGTGTCFDWSRIPKECSLPILLAGGLSRSNVKDAIARVRPYAVDVSSAVESGRGEKDVAKMAEFIDEVNQFDYARKQRLQAP